jgi:hypothetical protein
MSASSDAFFAPIWRWNEYLEHRLWVDELHARDLLEETIAAIRACSPERQDVLYRLLHRQLDSTDEVAEGLITQQQADEPLPN